MSLALHMYVRCLSVYELQIVCITLLSIHIYYIYLHYYRISYLILLL